MNKFHDIGGQSFVKEKQLQHSVVTHLAFLSLFIIVLSSKAQALPYNTFIQGDDANIYVYCQNQTSGVPCPTASTTCVGTLHWPNASIFAVERALINDPVFGEGYYNSSFGIVDTAGTYTLTYYCNNGNQSGDLSWPIIVTETNPQNDSFNTFYILLFGIFAILIYLGFTYEGTFLILGGALLTFIGIAFLNIGYPSFTDPTIKEPVSIVTIILGVAIMALSAIQKLEGNK